MICELLSEYLQKISYAVTEKTKLIAELKGF